MQDITVVQVNYNSAQVFESCLRPLVDAKKIIIVDNASIDDSVSRIEAAFPDARIIRNDRNLGYGTAMNQAVAAATTPYVLQVNPDSVINAENVGKLYEAAEQNKNAAIIAPLIEHPRRGITLSLMGPEDNRPVPVQSLPEGPFCTWFITGTIWLCRTDLFRRVGGFDESIFLYSEDTDFCLRVVRAGYIILVSPDAVALSLGSHSAPPSIRLQWRKEWNIVWSHLYVTEKFWGKREMRSEAWRLIRKHALKSLFYALILRQGRFRRDLAVTHAAVSYLAGIQSRRLGRTTTFYKN